MVYKGIHSVNLIVFTLLLVKADVKQMIYIAVLCNPKITAEPLYNTPLFIGPYAAANNTALLAWRPLQGTKLYCLVNRGTLGVNNLPRVVARIMPQSESNPRPLDHESTALPLHHRVTKSESLVHLILHISPDRSHHLRSHHMSLPRCFTSDLKLICSTNTFLRNLSGSIWTVFTDLELGVDLLGNGVCF